MTSTGMNEYGNDEYGKDESKERPISYCGSGSLVTCIDSNILACDFNQLI